MAVAGVAAPHVVARVAGRGRPRRLHARGVAATADRARGVGRPPRGQATSGPSCPSRAGAEKADKDDDVPMTPSVVVVVQDGTRRGSSAPGAPGGEGSRRQRARAVDRAGAAVRCRRRAAATSRRSPRAPEPWVTCAAGGLDAPVAFETLSVDRGQRVRTPHGLHRRRGRGRGRHRRRAVVRVVRGAARLRLARAGPPRAAVEEGRRRTAPGTKRPFALRALVGHAGDEPFYLDLKSQGPARARGRHHRARASRSSCRRGSWAWRRPTRPTGSRSSTSTTRAAPRSPTAFSCLTPWAWSRT